MAQAHPPIGLEEGEQDEQEEDEAAAAPAEKKEGQQETAAAKAPSATVATVKSSASQPTPAAEALAPARAGEGQHGTDQHQRQCHKRAEDQSPPPAHDCVGVPPPVRDWPQFVQNLALAAFCVRISGRRASHRPAPPP